MKKTYKITHTVTSRREFYLGSDRAAEALAYVMDNLTGFHAKAKMVPDVETWSVQKVEGEELEDPKK